MPTTNIDMTVPLAHPFDAVFARLKGRRMSAKAAVHSRRPRTRGYISQILNGRKYSISVYIPSNSIT